MFDIKQYYKQAHSGERVENSDLLNHIKNIPKLFYGEGVLLEKL